MCTYLHRAPNGRYYFRMGIPAKLRPAFGGKREIKQALNTADRAMAKGMIPAMTGKAHGMLNEARAKLGVPAPASPPPPVFAGPIRNQDDYDRWLADNPHYEYYPDDDEREDFEAWKASLESSAPVPAAHSIKALFERYAETGMANPKTVKRWRSRVADLVAFLEHEDVTRVTRADLNRWIAALVAGGLKGKTITDGYLPAVRTAFNIAHDDEIIPANPASGLTVRAPKPVQLRERELTDAEAVTILAATTKPQPAKLAAEHKLARRWAPWLCAYTGARIGEITQLRPCDILQIDGVWCIHITPEAGSVKTNKARKVPLHPHLIEQGFTKFAKAGDKTPLFYRDGVGSDENPGSKIRATALGDWVRSLGLTDVPQPNHGWRHRFKTQARMLGIPEEVHDAITGHAPPNEGRKYGSMPLPVLVEAIGKLPRYLT